MKKLTLMLVTVLLVTFVFGAAAVQADPGGDACWGQASAVLAQTGEMGEHSSEQATPRLGLRNLARSLSDAGAIPEDSMQALGAFFATELGLSIDACL